MQLTDTHCHLQFDKLAERIGEVMSQAAAGGVTRMICVGTSPADSHQAVEYAQKYDNVWAAVGAHPHDGKDFDSNKDTEVLKELMTRPKVVAVGEIGLDFYKDYSPKDDQEKLFRLQLEAGLLTGLPFIFHVRDAWKDFWRIMDDYTVASAVVHSFSAGQKQLDKIMDRGWYVGLNGIMTFTRDEAQLAAAKNVPSGRLLLETDAPFLGPAPERPAVCEPKHVRVTAEFLADLRDEPLEDLAQRTTDNAQRLFNLK